MRDQKLDLLADLLAFINSLERGNKTIIFMTVLLISWKGMEVAQVEKIIMETKVCRAICEATTIRDEDIH